MKRSFVDEIRSELDQQELDQYYELMRAIKENRIAEAEAFTSLDELLEGHDSLIVGLNNFLNSYYPVDRSSEEDDGDEDDDHSNSDDEDGEGDSNCSDNGKELLSKTITDKFVEAMDFVERIGERFGQNMGAYRTFHDTMLKRRKKNLEMSDVYTRVAAILGKHPDLMSEFELYSSERRLMEDHQDPDDGVVLDERPRIRIAPSYVLLPGDNIEAMNANGGEDQEEAVLNNLCVSEPPGSVDFSNRAANDGNEYENILEDQRYQIDLLSESLKSTARMVQKYLDFAYSTDGPKPPIKKEDYLKPRHIRCIEYLYGEYGLNVIDILKWKPKIVLPVLMNRLNQKQAELRKFYSALFKKDTKSCMLGSKSQEVDDLDRQLLAAERYAY